MLVESGGQCVMTPGIAQMHKLCADSLDTRQLVSRCIYHYFIIIIMDA